MIKTFLSFAWFRYDKILEENVNVCSTRSATQSVRTRINHLWVGTMKSPVVLEASSEDDSSSISLNDGKKKAVIRQAVIKIGRGGEDRSNSSH